MREAVLLTEAAALVPVPDTDAVLEPVPELDAGFVGLAELDAALEPV